MIQDFPLQRVKAATLPTNHAPNTKCPSRRLSSVELWSRRDVGPDTQKPEAQKLKVGHGARGQDIATPAPPFSLTLRAFAEKQIHITA